MIEILWNQFVSEVRACKLCSTFQPPLIERNAYPLFMKEAPVNTDLLFIAEAPNYGDTFHTNKGYLTVELLADPSGRFFHKMLTEVLQLKLNEFYVTNAVLCLPRKNNGNYPVTAKQIGLCLPHLVNQIQTFNPKIVCTLGGVALNAIRKIEDHGYRFLRESAGKSINWYNRILFPLYHTSDRARFGPTGRRDELQIEDYKKLKLLYNDLKYKNY